MTDHLATFFVPWLCAWVVYAFVKYTGILGPIMLAWIVSVLYSSVPIGIFLVIYFYRVQNPIIRYNDP
jgi:hypothetical protein